MTANIPLVSIIMATYNRAHLIEDTLETILCQSYKMWECIIIDDGSVDNTEEILQPFLLKDGRFKYYKRVENYKKGLPGCRNYGLDLSKGDYIIYFDDDDIVHPDNLQICVEILSSGDLSFCRYDKMPFFGDWEPEKSLPDSNFTSKIVDINRLENVIMGDLPFASCTVMWKKECFDGNRFNEELLYAEEWECYSRILSKGIKGISIDKVLYYNRKHPNSNTGEFFNNNAVRRASNLMAIKLVIDNLSNKRLLSPTLVKYFIRTGFLLKEISIVKEVLNHSNAGTVKSLKYLWGFRIYPILKPFFNFKAKLKKI